MVLFSCLTVTFHFDLLGKHHVGSLCVWFFYKGLFLITFLVEFGGIPQILTLMTRKAFPYLIRERYEIYYDLIAFAIGEKSAPVGMTNKHCSLLRDSHTAPIVRFSSASSAV